MNKKSLEFFIAWRYLFHRTGEGFISLISVFSFLGITLGVATLIIVMSVMNGFREKLIENIVGINGHINIISQTNLINDYQSIIKKLEAHNEIVRITPLIQGQTLANTDDTNVGLLVLGLDKIDDKKSLLKNLEKEGDFDDEKKIIIGARFAESLNLKINDQLNLISPKSMSSIIGEIPRMKKYDISGIFESGIHDFDANTIFMPLKQAQIFFQIYDSVNKIEIYLSSPYLSQKVMRELKDEFDSNQDLIINDWQDANSHYLGALNSEKNVMFLILSLIILIAVFNVISGLVMMVTEKQKSIAILRSFGMTQGSVMRIFIYSGMLISITSTILGTGLGIIVSKNINSIKLFLEKLFDTTLFDPMVYIFNEMPSKVISNDVLYIVLFTLFVSFLAVIPPSRKAAKIDPAKILRYL